jgi:ubiquinone/menaquinone biosynthesis C-methylase UbiE
MGIGHSIRVSMQDWAMRRMNRMRPGTVGLATGEVLEIGFGTGINLEFYPAAVTGVTALDPMEELTERIRKRIASSTIPLRQFALRADGELPFDNDSFDTVITTWTLCSIPDPIKALREMGRVLKPSGRYLFLEHGLSALPNTAKWQNRLNPCWCRFADGCNMNRAIDELVREAGLEILKLDRFKWKGPRILTEGYRGVAKVLTS